LVREAGGRRSRQPAQGPRREIATSPLLLGHSVLVGLTPLLPVPFLDDHLKAYFERRLARALAASRGVVVSEDDLRAIGEGAEDLMAQIGKGALLLPVRLLLRKVFLFLNVKRASDAASATYHRGYLLDVALEAGAHPPQRSASELRAAIAATLDETPHSPIGAAVRLSFEGSKALLRQALAALVGTLRRMRATSTEVDLAEALKESKDRDVFASLVDRVRQAVDEIPAAYFQELEERFLEHLAGRIPPVPDGD
jgi:hypothetical protein